MDEIAAGSRLLDGRIPTAYGEPAERGARHRLRVDSRVTRGLPEVLDGCEVPTREGDPIQAPDPRTAPIEDRVGQTAPVMVDGGSVHRV